MSNADQTNTATVSEALLRVVYLGSHARRAYFGEPVKTIEIAQKMMRQLKRRGMTTWIETGNGTFAPVPGAKRKPAERI